jgi:ribosomal protein L33
MCNCRERVNKGVSKALGKEGEIINYEMLSGRTYSTFQYQDGKRKKEQLILHTYCPTCGKKYEE